MQPHKDTFHGECDLVLVQNDQHLQGRSFDLHVRSTIESHFSYFSTGAMRVGAATFEFYPSFFLVDGIRHEFPSQLPFLFDGGIIEEKREPNKPSATHATYLCTLYDGSQIEFRFYKKFLTVNMWGHPQGFANATGLLGHFGTGEMIGRDGVKIYDEFTEFAFEWQVNHLAGDPSLFENNRSPQLPYERCRLPTAARPTRRRRLARNNLVAQARQACKGVETEHNFNLCVEDILATGDIGLADLW